MNFTGEDVCRAEDAANNAIRQALHWLPQRDPLARDLRLASHLLAAVRFYVMGLDSLMDASVKPEDVAAQRAAYLQRLREMLEPAEVEQ